MSHSVTSSSRQPTSDGSECVTVPGRADGEQKLWVPSVRSVVQQTLTLTPGVDADMTAAVRSVRGGLPSQWAGHHRPAVKEPCGLRDGRQSRAQTRAPPPRPPLAPDGRRGVLTPQVPTGSTADSTAASPRGRTEKVKAQHLRSTRRGGPADPASSLPSAYLVRHVRPFPGGAQTRTSSSREAVPVPPALPSPGWLKAHLPSVTPPARRPLAFREPTRQADLLGGERAPAPAPAPVRKRDNLRAEHCTSVRSQVQFWA